MREMYIGIDNGVTGTMAVIVTATGQVRYGATPVKREQDYTKAKKMIGRIDNEGFKSFCWNQKINGGPYSTLAVLERPMKSPNRKFFNTTISAMRCLEAQLIMLEEMEIGRRFVGPKEWQKDMLPTGTKGTAALKKASMDIGIQLFPQFKLFIEKHGDADGLLIAEWARRKDL